MCGDSQCQHHGTLLAARGRLFTMSQVITREACCRRLVAVRDARKRSSTELGKSVPPGVDKGTFARHLLVCHELFGDMARIELDDILSPPEFLIPDLRR